MAKLGGYLARKAIRRRASVTTEDWTLGCDTYVDPMWRCRDKFEGAWGVVKLISVTSSSDSLASMHAACVTLQTPYGSGLAIARHPSESVGCGPSVSALTGMGTALDIETTLAAGFDAHLTKPASLEDVLRWAHGASNVVPLFGDRRHSS